MQIYLLERADAVVVPDGRIGMISEVFQTTVMVQFGAAGPFGRYSPNSLRWVTEEEVKAAGMHGVGFNVLSISDREQRVIKHLKELEAKD
jgi:predicted Rossmann-fold nucleotide-binding protein